MAEAALICVNEWISISCCNGKPRNLYVGLQNLPHVLHMSRIMHASKLSYIGLLRLSYFIYNARKT